MYFLYKTCCLSWHLGWPVMFSCLPPLENLSWRFGYTFDSAQSPKALVRAHISSFNAISKSGNLCRVSSTSKWHLSQKRGTLGSDNFRVALLASWFRFKLISLSQQERVFCTQKNTNPQKNKNPSSALLLRTLLLFICSWFHLSLDILAFTADFTRSRFHPADSEMGSLHL